MNLHPLISTLIVIVELEGTQMGLKDRLLGAIGTSRMPLMPFNITGPPHDNEYAVEPAGVETSIPSHVEVETNSPLMRISKMTLFSCSLVMAI